MLPYVLSSVSSVLDRKFLSVISQLRVELLLQRIHTSSVYQTNAQHEALLSQWDRLLNQYHGGMGSHTGRLQSQGQGCTPQTIDLESGSRSPEVSLPAVSERLSELLRAFSQSVGAGAVVPDQFSHRLMSFFRLDG